MSQGGFRQSLTVDAAQIVPIPDKMTMAEAAMAEPLAVCLHAARRAGSLMGKRVLVTGCGPIGALMVLVAAHAGAADIVVDRHQRFSSHAGQEHWRVPRRSMSRPNPMA